jgi:hypothetical protein
MPDGMPPALVVERFDILRRSKTSVASQWRLLFDPGSADLVEI